MVIRRARYPGGTHNSRGEAGALVGIASAAVGSVQETQGSRHAVGNTKRVGFDVHQHSLTASAPCALRVACSIDMDLPSTSVP
jgi:hypothetical protein